MSTDKDLQQYIDTLFPLLPNNSHPSSQLMDERNFNRITLTYMTPSIIAREITDKIVEKYPGEAPILIVEICGGIGSFTLALSSHSKVGIVLTFEPRPDQSLMLQRNLKVYGTDDKVILISTPYSPEVDLSPFKGCVGVIDTASFLETMKDTVSITYNSFALEDILEKATGIFYLMVIHVPSHYELKSVIGWKYDIQNIVNGDASRVYYCTCDQSLEYINSNYSGMGPYYNTDISQFTVAASFKDPEPVLPPTSIYTNIPPPIVVKPIQASKPLQKYVPKNMDNQIEVNRIKNKSGYTIPESQSKSRYESIRPKNNEDENIRGKIGPVAVNVTAKNKMVNRKVVDNRHSNYDDDDENGQIGKLWSPNDIDFDNSKIPIPTGRNTPGSAEWILEFQVYINELLRIVIPDDGQRTKLLDPEYMPIWLRAWTHETYNPDPMQNYERLETQGDGLLAYAFRNYLSERNPKSTSSELSEYKSRYMSKEYQPLFSKELKMSHWLLAEDVDTNDDNVDIQEDLFESFFGAIATVMKTINRGKEIIIAQNYIAKIFAKTFFDSRILRGKPKTILVQYGNRFNWSLPEEEVREIDGKTVAYINFSRDGLQFFRDNANVILHNPIGVGEAMTLKLAKSRAYTAALKRLDEAGITHEWIADQREKKTFATFPPELVKRVRSKAITEFGVDTIRFHTPKSTSTLHYKVIQLIGFRESDKRRIKLASVKSNSEEHAKRQVLEKFVNS
jgi:dsRNA-specific ribonuclease